MPIDCVIILSSLNKVVGAYFFARYEFDLLCPGEIRGIFLERWCLLRGFQNRWASYSRLCTYVRPDQNPGPVSVDIGSNLSVPICQLQFASSNLPAPI